MKNTTLSHFSRATLAVALSLALAAPIKAQTMDELVTQMKALRDDLVKVKAELEAIKKQSKPESSDTTRQAEQKSVVSKVEQTKESASSSPMSLFGYGELNYERPRRNAAAAVATARRGVLGFGYRFNDTTRLVTELEVENAVVSAGDRGEVAFEQLYVEHDINDRVSMKLGLFLMPVGYLNEVHEPTKYFGVNRNLIETAIIPSTWRELGIGFKGTFENGLRVDAGLVTSFDLNKWDATSGEGKTSPLASIHQEGQLAKAASFATYGAINYNGIPGLNVGGSVYRGGTGHRQADSATAGSAVALAEAHARWQPGRWDVSALIASGRFTGVGALNSTFAGQPTPVPTSFGGWYLQSAYKLWKQGDYSLVPFARYERLNTAKSYTGLPQGLAPSIDPDTRVFTFGTSFYLNPQVVIKADLQRYLSNASLDKLNLGVGFYY